MKTRAIVSIILNLMIIGFIMSLSVYSYSATYSKVQNQTVEVAHNTAASVSIVKEIENNGLYLASMNYLQNEFI